MAILKHIALKNANYGNAVRYLLYKHDEQTGKTILDEYGALQYRDDFILDGINCNPYTYASECMATNKAFGKNQDPNEIKEHHYILSFDPADLDRGLTKEKAQDLGMEFARKYFPGHQILVCTHTDGDNGSGNIHVHIVLNSLRKLTVEHEEWMERPCDHIAGYKHHLSSSLLTFLKKNVMEMCEREGLNQVDLLSPAEKKVTDREYRAQQHGQKALEERNAEIFQDGYIPKKAKYETDKERIRIAVDDISQFATSFEMFKNELFEKYHILVFDKRGRYSYLPSNRKQPISERQLGISCSRDDLIRQFEENQKVPNRKAPPKTKYLYSAIFFKTDCRLIIDIQNNVKAQQSQRYAKKLKLVNLQIIADTVSFIAQNQINSVGGLEHELEKATKDLEETANKLDDTSKNLEKINKQIHYTGAYLKSKQIYADFLQAPDKKEFRQTHLDEIKQYEEARAFLKSEEALLSDGKIVGLSKLNELKKEMKADQREQKALYKKQMQTMQKIKNTYQNVLTILGMTNIPNHTIPTPTKKVSHSI